MFNCSIVANNSVTDISTYISIVELSTIEFQLVLPVHEERVQRKKWGELHRYEGLGVSRFSEFFTCFHSAVQCSTRAQYSLVQYSSVLDWTVTHCFLC